MAQDGTKEAFSVRLSPLSPFLVGPLGASCMLKQCWGYVGC